MIKYNRRLEVFDEMLGAFHGAKFGPNRSYMPIAADGQCHPTEDGGVRRGLRPWADPRSEDRL